MLMSLYYTEFLRVIVYKAEKCFLPSLNYSESYTEEFYYGIKMKETSNSDSLSLPYFHVLFYFKDNSEYKKNL